MMRRVWELLATCGGKDSVLPPTELYNEGWLLRLIVDWFDRNRESNHVLAFQDDARWYSEGLLASRFLPRMRGDPLAESFTHADGLIGHFQVAPGERGEVVLSHVAQQLLVLEAKMGSPLSKGVKNAPQFGQAARNVACIAHAVDRARLPLEQLRSLGFYVLAPQSQIDAGIFGDFVTKERIHQQVETRVAQYEGVHDEWLQQHFYPTLEIIDVGLISWESLIEHIQTHDQDAGIEEFYQSCLEFNPLRKR